MKIKRTKKSNIGKTMLFLLFITGSLWGQVMNKKMLTKEEYNKWSSLQSQAISADGKWACYSIHYESGNDTLIVSTTDGMKNFKYTNGRYSTFSGSKWFAYINNKNKLVLLSLVSGKEQHLENVLRFEFSEDGKNLITISRKKAGLHQINWINLQNNSVTKWNDVSSFSFNTNRTALAYTVEKDSTSELIIMPINASNNVPDNLFLEGKISTIVWQNNSKSIVFDLLSEKEEMRKLVHYRLEQKKMYFLDPLLTSGFPKEKKIALSLPHQLSISEDGLRILFQLEPIAKVDLYKDVEVEIWEGADSRVYAQREQRGANENFPTTVVWYPVSNTLLDFMRNETTVLLSGNQKMALSADFISCSPQFKYDNDKDFYLTNLTNGSRKLILSCHNGHSSYTFMSPQGKYVAYFKEGNWYSYDIEKDVHRNLTDKIEVSFYDENDDNAGAKSVFLWAGWTKDDAHLLVYDSFDLWKINSDGSSKERVTNGREKGIKYRLVGDVGKKSEPTFLSIEFPNVINLNSPLLLEAIHNEDSKQGLSILENSKVRPLFLEAKNTSMALKAKSNESFVFIDETYEQAPRLVFKHQNKEELKTIFQSNPQQQQYFWSYNKMITYTTKKGKKLKGLLYYPANYNPDVKYPMIVRIYEQQFYLKNKYIAPSLLNGNGVNITNFVMDGYFVFLPDIVYEVGSPGDSALDCVTAGVEEVLTLNLINAEKIGLTGHSFGGYETTYIIGKSKLFSVAVAGAAQTDLVSCYLTLSDAYKKPEIWRFENYSNRMGKMLFDDWDNYIYNSPVYNAAAITAPLLLWTGDKDGIVAPSQSMELYIALRRLQKKVVLLRYKGQHHALSTERNQIDLTSRISDWFNHYLKEKPIKDWMKTNVNL